MTNFSDIFKSDFLKNVTSVNIPDILLALLFSFILGLFIFWVYKRTCTSIMYSSSFGVTLVGLSLVTTLVILAVTSNVVLSLGMVGALSIVRFRTAIKEPLEIVFLFWTLAVGIVIGAGFYPLAVIGSSVVGVAIIFLSNKKAFEMPYILVMTLDNAASEKTVMAYLIQETKKIIVKTKTVDASHIELTCEVRLSDASTEFVNSLLEVNGVSTASLVSSMGTIWYKPMINSKKLDKFIPLLLVMAIVASLILVPFVKIFSETGTIQGYEKTIFDTKTSLTVNIDIAKENWSDLLANASSKKYYPCDVTINGIAYKNVGIRTKGSSSLDDVNLTFKNDRYSLLIKFDKYTKGQNCNGLTKLALNNIIYDATYMKDAIAYDMAHYIGLSAPLTNYANVSINNESMGLYMAVEPVSNSYVARTLGNDKVVVYEPFGSPEYLDDDIDSYTNITTDVKVGKSTKKSKTVLRNAIKSVYTGENIEEYVDVENIMKYLALQTVSVNYDSVLGNSGHNYYLYVSNGKIGIIPWDYNLAFGGYTDSDDFDYDALDGFLNLTEEEYEKLSDDELETLEEQAFEAYYNSLSEEEKTKFDEAASFDNAAEANKYVNFPIDSPFSCSLSDRTFFLKLLENETYKEMYYKYLNQLCSYINDGQFDITIQKIDNKIGTTAGMGTTDFYTNTEYKTAISTFKELLKLKSTSILAQLNGKIPTTWDGQEKSPDSLIDATHINLKDMGGSFD